jgi:hypothetical protein
MYIPLHVSIGRDHHQVVYEYTSIVIELSIKMNPLLTFTINILIKIFKFKVVNIEYLSNNMYSDALKIKFAKVEI